VPLPLLVIVTALVWLTAGIVVVYAWRAQRAAAIPETWMKQLATIVVSEVREEDFQGPRRISVGNTPIRGRFVPRVEYTYTVGDIEYRSATIDRGPRRGWSWRGAAEKRAARFPRGKIVDVFVDRTQPEVSALVAGAGDATLSLWIIGGVMMVLGVIVPIVAR
jgi:hypothetical protein